MVLSITASNLFDGFEMRGPSTVSWEDGLIVEIRDAQPHEDTHVDLLSPGYIDLQVNGVGDRRVADHPFDLAPIAELLSVQGVTTWLPTVPTQRADFYALENIDALVGACVLPPHLPQAVGVHCEGPLLGGKPGAHRSDYFAASPSILDALALARMVTLAPEHPLASEATSFLAARGVLVALGHTTATSQQVDEFVRRGGRCATHLFNAMSGIDHVTGGVALSVLNDSRIAFSMIVDLEHVSAEVVAHAWRHAADRMFLVSDQVSTIVDASMNDSARLRGARVGLDQGVRNLVQSCRVPIGDALAAASRIPAEVLGLSDRGQLSVGRRADFVLLDADLSITGVVCSGFPSKDLSV